MNRRVSVWKYVRLKNGRWRYCKPALAKNGKIRPDWVIVKGKAEHHPEGNFYVHRYDNGREIWRKIGESAQEAVDAADFEGTYLHAKSRGIPVKEINTPVLSIDAATQWIVSSACLGQNNAMLETLYKTRTPEASVWDGEYYELFLHAKSVAGHVVYLVVEKHGWWDEEAKRSVNNYATLSPEEGYATFEEAHNRYKLQRSTRAKGGFTHSFSPDYSGRTKYVYEPIKPS